VDDGIQDKTDRKLSPPVFASRSVKVKAMLVPISAQRPASAGK
jgi:hypothetical protein